ncbi:MAG: aminoglycoside adenylyltransferase domain-containing protein [Chloroflexota bacterium]
MHIEIPKAIEPLLQEYMFIVKKDLPDLVDAFYIHGSIALGAFHERFSDIDFITVISRQCTESDLHHLRGIHKTLALKYPRWELEGSYLQWDDLGQLEETITPHPNYHDGIVSPAERNDVNSITWWILKNQGVALLGPEPQNLAFDVDLDVLLVKMKHNLNTYWVNFTNKPRRIAWIYTDDGLQWAVLGVLRQFYTFKEKGITSKTGAGEYALTHLPSRWHRLIQEALNIRGEVRGSLYKSRISRTVETVNFLKYVIRTCNALLL